MVTVETENLKARGEVVLEYPQVYSYATSIAYFLAMLTAVVVDVIYSEEGFSFLTTAVALIATVRLKYSVFDLSSIILHLSF